MNNYISEDTSIFTTSGPKSPNELIGVNIVSNGVLYKLLDFSPKQINDFYKITTSKGYSVTLTSDIKLLRNERWVIARDLNSGDEISLSNHRNYSIINNEQNNEFTMGILGSQLYIAGLWAFGKSQIGTLDEGKSNDYLKGYICGLFDSLGRLKGNSLILKKKGPLSLKSVQNVLYRFGIISSITDSLLIIEKDNILYYHKYIGFNKKSKVGYLNTYIKIHKNLLQKETFTDTIMSIERLSEKQFFYKISVDQVHEFCANGIRIHE